MHGYTFSTLEQDSVVRIAHADGGMDAKRPSEVTSALYGFGLDLGSSDTPKSIKLPGETNDVGCRPRGAQSCIRDSCARIIGTYV